MAMAPFFASSVASVFYSLFSSIMAAVLALATRSSSSSFPVASFAFSFFAFPFSFYCTLSVFFCFTPVLFRLFNQPRHWTHTPISLYCNTICAGAVASSNTWRTRPSANDRWLDFES